ncbi:MAG: acyltransferase family protein [Bacteroidaceae bacterium]
MEKERYDWIDYAKFISIFLVISFHTPPHVTGYIGELIRQLRMPAFFLISGFLFNFEKFQSFIYFFKHRSIQLLIPYVSFFFIFYFLWLIFGNYLGEKEDINSTFYQPIIEFIYGNPQIITAPYWFICCLFSIQIIYYLLKKNIPNYLIFPICLIFPFINCMADFYALPWNISNAFKYIPFYAFANQYKIYIKKIDKISPLIIVLGLSYFIIIYYLTYTDNNFLKTLLFIISGISILPVYILFCKSIANIFKRKYIIQYIGKNTIIILALQNYVIGVIKIICYKFGGNNFFEGKYLLNILISLFVIAIIYIPIIIINRYFPFIIGRGKYFQYK